MGMFAEQARRHAEREAADKIWHRQLFDRIIEVIDGDRDYLEAQGVTIEMDEDDDRIALARYDDSGEEVIDAELDITLDVMGKVTVGDEDEGEPIDAGSDQDEVLRLLVEQIVEEFGLKPGSGDRTA